MISKIRKFITKNLQSFDIIHNTNEFIDFMKFIKKFINYNPTSYKVQSILAPKVGKKCPKLCITPLLCLFY